MINDVSINHDISTIHHQHPLTIVSNHWSLISLQTCSETFIGTNVCSQFSHHGQSLYTCAVVLPPRHPSVWKLRATQNTRGPNFVHRTATGCGFVRDLTEAAWDQEPDGETHAIYGPIQDGDQMLVGLSATRSNWKMLRWWSAKWLPVWWSNQQVMLVILCPWPFRHLSPLNSTSFCSPPEFASTFRPRSSRLSQTWWSCLIISVNVGT